MFNAITYMLNANLQLAYIEMHNFRPITNLFFVSVNLMYIYSLSIHCT